MSSDRTFEAISFTQNGRRIFLTSMTAADLLELTIIERYDPHLPHDHPDQGYQRAPEGPRIRKMAKYAIESGNDLLVPTTILLSSRGVALRYDEKSGELTVPRGNKLVLIDGQHRQEGFGYAITVRNHDELRDFPLPVAIVDGLSKIGEMRQFATVNGEQKGVRTDLVSMILTQIQMKEGDVPERDLWRVVASRVIEMLNSDTGDGPWFDLITMPNESRYKKAEIKADPSLAHKKVIRATSFLSSIKPIHDYLKEFNLMGDDQDSQVEEICGILNAFWEAVRLLNSEPFERPGDYVLQKTPGLFSMHRILRRLLPIMHSARLNWKDSQEHVRQLEDIADLQNPEYWDASEKGAAVYGSQKGFKELSDSLWEDRGM